MEELRQIFRRFFLYENDYSGKKDILIFGGQPVPIGSTLTILSWVTEKKAGAFTGFNFGFSNFIPAPGSYNFNIKMDAAIIPQSDNGGIFDYSQFLNQDIEFFKDFDASGSHLIQAQIINIGAVVIYPVLTIKGFYTS